MCICPPLRSYLSTARSYFNPHPTPLRCLEESSGRYERRGRPKMLSGLGRGGLRVVYEEVSALGVNSRSALGGNISSNGSYFQAEGADAKENLGSRKQA